MTRRTLDDLDAHRLLNGGPVALITTRWRTSSDVMPAIWHTPLSRVPPLLGVVVHPSRHTHDMMRFSEQFALNFPARDLLNHTHYFGMVSGRDVGKLELSKLATFGASKIDVPLLANCVAWVECVLEDTHRLGDHTLFIGRIVAVQADKEAFDETWLADDPAYRPVHYLGVDRYATLGERLTPELRTSDDGAIELHETTAEREEREEHEAIDRERRERDPEAPPA